MEKDSLDKIWGACLRRSRKAQFELYQLFSKKMFAICIRYTESEQEAEDVLQIGFLKVFTNCHDYKGNGSLEGWIRRIIINTALEFHRKNKYTFTNNADEHLQSIISSQETHHPIYYKDLLSLVKTLPLGYRTVFNLAIIEGYSHKEIAIMLSISEGNSKSQLSRARLWLKEKLISIENINS
ncbi:sigma-70 family RNA polymerase sigma factor [Sphingobacterium sp. UT-1RO-CII-1]|uniref:RNA polymerase sigma factor n=1 Tax=Sphingobacterium sp. UT-1RO-CII-1 TaxID=2995225 RepID=UPI00227D5167|nr:sigma-70 family RNA polymerase sigma factor [Sphingobacterium sp. UT-1RO-CII-1]MCY4781001.1 sigma-70 family RNA polymerase sigma factor [Sphingobacterium sp. UT-1RO-CII-1]